MRKHGPLALHAAATFVTLAFAAGCSGPGLPVSDWQAPPVDVGGEHRLFLAESYGPREGLQETRAIVADVVHERGWFVGCDSPEGALSLDVDVLEWFTETSQEARDAGTDDQGNDVVEIVDVESAHAYLSATVTDARGRVLLDGYEVEGIHTEDGGFSDELAALDLADRDAVNQVMDQITPTNAPVFVPFDDRDADERPILEQAQKSRLAGAIDLETAYVAAHAGKAAPLYNRAVMLEASGDFASALNGYDDALAASPDEKLRDLAIDARAGCVARRDNARALGL